MTSFEPRDPNYVAKVHESFAQQALMTTFGATLEEVLPGKVTLAAPYAEAFTQQDGFLHAGVVTALIDSACGYAAYSLMPAGTRVLSTEFKVNLLSPARGTRFIAVAEVLKAGRTLTVCRGDLFAEQDGSRRLIAAMQAGMICLGPTS